VFNNLQKALAIYAGSADQDETPIKDKEALVKALEEVLGQARTFTQSLGVDTESIMAVDALSRLSLIAKAVEVLVAPDDRRREFSKLAGAVTKAYKALLPDERAAPYLKPVAVLHMLADAVKAKLGPVDISAIQAKIAELLDEKLEGVAILTPIVEGAGAEGRVDLSSIDFDKLAKLFETSPKVAAERVREEAENKVKKMAEANPTRVDLVGRLEKLVAEYNAGSIDTEKFFEALKEFVAGLSEEEERASRERLTEEELAIFDMLTTPEPKLTKTEETEVKRVARALLAKLRELMDGVDWWRSQETRGAVWSEIRQRLNELPQEPYPDALWNAKVNQVWDFVTRRYVGDGARIH
jgi:type I restriction enzyme R subunit